MGRLRRLLLLALLGTLPAACSHVPVALGGAERLRTSEGDFSLEFEPSDAAGAGQVRHAIEAAAPRLARWGRLRLPVTVRVMPDHDNLERAVGRSGYDWLRAWANFDTVTVQSPSSWFETGTPSQDKVDELLLHELTHTLMYQLAARADAGRLARIPVWFREGMASVTAEQAYRRSPLGELRRLLLAEGDVPLRAAERDFRADNSAVYATAHHAFAYLVKRIGDDGVKRILAAMFAGGDFDEAFLAATGRTRQSFEQDFRGYIVEEAWREGALGPAAPAASPNTR